MSQSKSFSKTTLPRARFWARRPVSARRRRMQFLPRVDLMEDRKLLSTLTVMNNHDSGSGSLRATIAAATSGDTIDFSSKLRGETITLTSGELVLGVNLTIDGLGANQLAISGNNASRVFQVDPNVTASISGLTISGGNTAGNGGGMYNDGGNVTLADTTVSGNSSRINIPSSGGGGLFSLGGTTTLTNCIVSGNSAVRDGGGLFNSNGTIALTNCTVTGNSASLTGGGEFSLGGTTTLTNCTVSGNSATGTTGAGGGLCNFNGTTTLTDCTFHGNSTANEGGGVYNFGSLTVDHSTFDANQASGWGGAIDSFDGHIDLLDSRFTGNSAGNTGGAVSNSGGSGSISGCTFSGNHAGSTGGGGISVYSGALTIANTTIADNSSASPGGGMLVSGSVTLTNCTVSGNTAVDGGGIYSNGMLNVSCSNIINNTAIGDAGGAGSGGGIFSNGGSVALSNSALSLNPHLCPY